jgi:hypothetical protein
MGNRLAGHRGRSISIGYEAGSSALDEARQPMSGATVKWIHSWPDGAEPRFRVGRVGADLIAEWVGFAQLRVDRDGNRSELTFQQSDVHPAAVAKLEKGHVQGLLRHLQGRLTVHGSGVVLGGHAILLTGNSGSGKSSMGAALCLRHGAQFVADDMAAIEMELKGFSLGRLEDSHWLLDDAAQALGLEAGNHVDEKQSLAAGRLARGPAPLRLIVQLAFDDALDHPEVRRVEGHEAFELISRSAVRFVLDEPSTTLRDFEQVASLAASVPIFVLSRPAGIENLNRDIATILELLRAQRVGVLEQATP